MSSNTEIHSYHYFRPYSGGGGTPEFSRIRKRYSTLVIAIILFLIIIAIVIIILLLRRQATQ